MVKVVTEISCYLDNQPGVLATITQKLADKGIDILGIQAYEGQLQNLVTMVVDKVDMAEKILRSFGVELISRKDVLSVKVKNEVGSLAKVTSLLGNNEINLESFYVTASSSEGNTAYLRLSDTSKAVKVLKGAEKKNT